MNIGTIRKTIGVILCIEAAFMLPPLLLALADGDASALRGFAAAIAAVLAVGVPCGLIKSKDRPLGARDGFVTVALAWIIISLFGAIPFYASGVIGSVSDAVFETISGFSTTGATIIDDVEAAPRAILLWRSITNWIGGMGVLVFLLAIAPVAREGGSMFLLRAEFPGPMAAKLVPRMQKSAKLLYEIYIAMTVVQIVLLLLGGIPLFDSVNISLSTVSTGGFCVRNDSMASYGAYAQNVTLVFMTLCSMSFSLFYLRANFCASAAAASCVPLSSSSWALRCSWASTLPRNSRPSPTASTTLCSRPFPSSARPAMCRSTQASGRPLFWLC